jgi:Protein of unknown function (DUF1161)
MPKRPRSALVILAAAIAAWSGGASSQALSCEELRAKVEAKIRSNGVKVFTVEIVDATSKPQGQVVGTCESGTKQLVYSREITSTASASEPARAVAAASAASGNKAKTPVVITECADGRVITTGSCKK